MQRLWIDQIESERAAWEALLSEQGIRPEKTLDATYGLYEGSTLIATASHFQNIIKCVAIADAYKGGSVFHQLLSELINTLYRLGHSSIFVYTKPSAAAGFGHLGFREIARVEGQLVFLERSETGITEFLKQQVPAERPAPGERVGAIVLNANPMTLGHFALIEQAHQQVEQLHLFLVSEERSLFPFAVRKRLVAEATAPLAHTFLHETGPYLVSSQTFPSYFLRESDDVTEVQARLDAQIFKQYFAPLFGITHRFVGEEPFSRATALYNQAMRTVFAAPPAGPQFVEIPRVTQAGVPISASAVRKHLALGEVSAACALVPPAVSDFLRSPEAAPLLEALKKDRSLGAKDADLPVE